MENPDTDFVSYYDSPGKLAVKAFVTDVDAQPEVYHKVIKDHKVFNHILSNIRTTLGVFTGKREATIFNNYIFHVYK